MKVLVLGGSGYIGSRLCAVLGESGFATPINGSMSRDVRGIENVRVETTDPESMTRAMRGVDAVVNCVAGDAQSISRGAQILADAAAKAGCGRIVHLSSMSVYGRLEGDVREDAPLDPSIGWYAKAKCEAEQHVAAFASRGGAVVMFRPGCVWGPGSDLWVGRIGRFLRARRLGDLGAAGDGWSNLVHVDDVCAAIVASLRASGRSGETHTYNLAAPDSPRWNDYFVDLALAIGATPVPRLSARRLRLDAKLAGPPLKVAEILLRKAGRSTRSLPDPMPPGLLGLWERHLRLDSSLAERELGLQWTPYAQGLKQSTAWFVRAHEPSSASALGAHKAI